MLRALAFAAVLVAGCGGSTATWSGPVELRPRNGELDVGEFRDYAEDVDEVWERAPVLIALEFLQRVEGVTPRVSGPVGVPRVVLLRDDLEDDSVRSERWVFELEPGDDVWQLVSARWEQRCHVGRGHQHFSPDLCL